MDDATPVLANTTDLAAFWMPFTANRPFKAAPRLLASASGMYYRTEDGREVLDGTSGLWCVNAGHGRIDIADAVHKQLMTLDYAPTFQMGHPIVFDFATALAKIAPTGLDRIFFTNSGSESVDTALKMAMAYHRARGQGQRTRIIGREKGYHGVGFGGISVGGLVNNRRTFVTLPADHIRHTHDMARNAFSRGLPTHGAERADDLEQIIALHGAETIAAMIVEPVAGSTGVLPPPVGYLERLRAICDAHGILLIFDEVQELATAANGENIVSAISPSCRPAGPLSRIRRSVAASSERSPPLSEEVASLLLPSPPSPRFRVAAGGEGRGRAGFKGKRCLRWSEAGGAEAGASRRRRGRDKPRRRC